MLQLFLSFALALALMSMFILNTLQHPYSKTQELLDHFKINKKNLAKISWVCFFTFAIGCLLLIGASL